MYNIHSLMKKRFPDEPKIWSYKARALATPDNFVSFGYPGEVKKVPTIATVSWRPDLQLLTAEFVSTMTFHGLALENRIIPTDEFNVLGLQTLLDGNVVASRKLVLARAVENENGVDSVPVPLHDADGSIARFVLGHADVFIYEQILPIVDADRIAALMAN